MRKFSISRPRLSSEARLDKEDILTMNVNKCGNIGCENKSNFVCSNCHLVYYCSKEHQKLDWKRHKLNCKEIKNKEESLDSNRSNIDVNSSVGNNDNNAKASENKNELEVRQCRCMFCGETHVFHSEEEAVGHLRVCVALNEQLSSPDQFTVPQSILKKNQV